MSKTANAYGNMEVITKIKILIVLVLLLCMGLLLPTKGFIHNDPQTNNTEAFRYQYEHSAVPITEEMFFLVNCESKWNPDAVGDLDYIYQAYGLTQIQKRTFKWLSKKAGMEGDINSDHDQLRLLKWALDNGYCHLWSCCAR
ncbi:MAG: transglycosylase SLT domain-containing protein [Candidatus Portnoybacteria bacterium]|nr:transglycosylase SLT domain-containing protein [Candidatus Portnoybacteria bacterium]